MPPSGSHGPISRRGTEHGGADWVRELRGPSINEFSVGAGAFIIEIGDVESDGAATSISNDMDVDANSSSKVRCGRVNTG